MTTPQPRDAAQRKRDTLACLEQEVDAWVASANPKNGTPHLIPLSFLWDGRTFLFSTPSSSPTSRNLQSSKTVRLGIGPTRDLILIEGSVSIIADSDISVEIGDAFASRTGFDPRQQTTTYVWLRVRPARIQAWREANELEGRVIMRGGLWLIP